jgi:hypothetical protein
VTFNDSRAGLSLEGSAPSLPLPKDLCWLEDERKKMKSKRTYSEETIPNGVSLGTKRAHLLLLILGLSFALGCASPKPVSWREGATQPHPWGYYSGSPVTSWNPDGRSMTLLHELRYTDPNGVVWVAPAGSVVDGASIPRSLWSFMGGPFEGRYRNASVLHDVSYDQKDRPPQDCDRMFYNAMRCSGVGAVEAKTMYYSLLRFGRHWKFSVKRAKPFKIGRKTVARAEPQIPRAVPVSQDEIESARDWIRKTKPTPEQIERRVAAEAPW